MVAARIRVAALLVGLAAIGLGCSEASAPTAPTESAAPAPLLGSLLGTADRVLPLNLLACTPLPYAADTLVVDERGGRLQAGPHSLEIPRGALPRGSRVRITMESLSDSVNSVRLLPEGLHFEKTVTLRLSYRNCPLVGQLVPKKVVYTTEQLRILELIPSLDNIITQSVSGRLEHFSKYAVAY